MCHHKRWPKVRKAESVNRWMKYETCGGLSCTRSLSDVKGNITSYRDFTNISISYFDKWFAEKKICAQWVPHCLTAEEKQKCLENAKLLKQRFNIEDQEFLYRIVPIDEIWVRDFEPEMKLQSNEWRNPNSPCPKKFWWAQSKVKQMMIFAYDHRGIIMTEFHVEQVLQQCIIVTGCKKCVEKCTKTWPDLFRDGPFILHDSAHLHLGKVVIDLLSKYEWEVSPYTPYSPDMRPLDFDLFHKLKQPMHGHHFPSLEEVSAVVTRAIRGLNKSGTLHGTANLPTCWDSVIEKQGDYIEEF